VSESREGSRISISAVSLESLRVVCSARVCCDSLLVLQALRYGTGGRPRWNRLPLWSRLRAKSAADESSETAGGGSTCMMAGDDVSRVQSIHAFISSLSTAPPACINPPLFFFSFPSLPFLCRSITNLFTGMSQVFSDRASNQKVRLL
jgi:hypothetical protein